MWDVTGEHAFSFHRRSRSSPTDNSIRPQVFNFTGLPAEIQIMILKEAVTVACPIRLPEPKEPVKPEAEPRPIPDAGRITRFRKSAINAQALIAAAKAVVPPPKKVCKYCARNCNSCQPDAINTALFVVSKYMSESALAVFYSENRFLANPKFLAKVATARPARLFIRRLTLAVDDLTSYNLAEVAKATLRYYRNLKELTVDTAASRSMEQIWKKLAGYVGKPIGTSGCGALKHNYRDERLVAFFVGQKLNDVVRWLPANVGVRVLLGGKNEIMWCSAKASPVGKADELLFAYVARCQEKGY
ncbi:hypothetical protein BT63DRAFT_409440 [Microthyrium microscopicum]|uniref:Uncharacterized protein n=1 Tax=Microthyrium microscopicum TaxID=703497 RepID=A0A6A6UWI9_9PEZI|nr:hypothetical protein BT63DRAFT_409440 [Microthyrium microscopicum]